MSLIKFETGFYDNFSKAQLLIFLNMYARVMFFSRFIFYWKSMRMVERSGNVNGHIENYEIMECHKKSYVWKPGDIIGNDFKFNKGFACLVVNHEIRIPPHVVKTIWQNAMLRCITDGGANFWRYFLRDNMNTIEITLKPPDLIIGDFDSITPATRQYFTNDVTKFQHTPDQLYTDFTKSINIIRPLLLNVGDIIVFQEVSGRFDQILANINTLYLKSNFMLNIYLLSSNSLTWLLKPGKHIINVPPDLVECKGWCSLIPIGNNVTNVSTQGLKWNLNNDSLSFGNLISTSNTYNSTVIEIQTNGNLIWSMGVFSFND